MKLLIFKELSEEAKAKAIKDYIAGWLEGTDENMTEDEALEILNNDYMYYDELGEFVEEE